MIDSRDKPIRFPAQIPVRESNDNCLISFAMRKGAGPETIARALAKEERYAVGGRTRSELGLVMPKCRCFQAVGRPRVLNAVYKVSVLCSSELKCVEAGYARSRKCTANKLACSYKYSASPQRSRRSCPET